MAASIFANTTWSCASCTFRNDSSSISCQMCGAQYPNAKESWQCNINHTNDLICEACNQWNCSTCTMLNENNATSCKICHKKRVQSINEEKADHILSSICNGVVKE
eukprot:414194_1